MTNSKSRNKKKKRKEKKRAAAGTTPTTFKLRVEPVEEEEPDESRRTEVS